MVEFVWRHLIAQPRKPPDRGFLRDICYTSLVITNFVLNFVAMATGVGRCRICLASFNSKTPKTHCYYAKISGISQCSTSVRNTVVRATFKVNGKPPIWGAVALTALSIDLIFDRGDYVSHMTPLANKKAQLSLTNPRDAKACKKCSNSTCLQRCRLQYWPIFIRRAGKNGKNRPAKG